jgi:hypothetical protein
MSPLLWSLRDSSMTASTRITSEDVTSDIGTVVAILINTAAGSNSVSIALR